MSQQLSNLQKSKCVDCLGLLVPLLFNTYQVSCFWSSVDNLSSRRNIWKVVDHWLLVKRNIKCFSCFPDHICSTYRSQVNILWILYILNSTFCHCHSTSNYGSCYPDDKDIDRSCQSVENEPEPQESMTRNDFYLLRTPLKRNCNELETQSWITWKKAKQNQLNLHQVGLKSP